MRVFRLNLRTPGIFLDREGNDFKGTLEFQMRIHREGENTDDWKKPEELGIKVIGLDKVNSVSTTLVLKELNVPTRDEGKREFDIIVPDTDSYDYRILATNCPDCWNLFKEIKQGEILDSDDKRGRIVVGSGTIN